MTASGKRQANRIVKRLAREYPDATCSLDFQTPLQLLVATILSAQCTDERVNRVTKGLFAKYPNADDYARARITSLEAAVRSTGFYRNKAKNIRACCKALVEEHQGDVPRELEALVALPGVGRKTANVVLGTGFGIVSGVVVDTHVGRLSRRMGLTDEKTPEKIERDLIACLPRAEWVAFSHRMIQHGRRHCMARTPKCESCPAEDICPRVGVGQQGAEIE